MGDATFRARRSVLYMPSSNTKALEKAKTLAADGIIFDLEDAVAPDAKPAARAAGVAILDGVYNDVKDAEGFAAECRQGRDLGFDGKTVIHPGQIEAANEAFAPSPKAVEDARGILQAWEDGRGSGVVTYNG